MIMLLQLAASIVALGVAFFYPAYYSFLVLLPVVALLIMFWIGTRDYNVQTPSGLSVAARTFLERYPQYYLHPDLGRQCSGTASSLMLTLVLLTVISCFKGFWWSILISIVLVAILAPLQRFFNPTHFLTSGYERTAHDELIEALSQRHEELEGPGSPSSRRAGQRMFTVQFRGGFTSDWVDAEQVIQWFTNGKIDLATWVFPSDTRDWVRVGEAIDQLDLLASFFNLN